MNANYKKIISCELRKFLLFYSKIKFKHHNEMNDLFDKASSFLRVHPDDC